MAAVVLFVEAQADSGSDPVLAYEVRPCENSRSTEGSAQPERVNPESRL